MDKGTCVGCGATDVEVNENGMCANCAAKEDGGMKEEGGMAEGA